MTGQVQISVVQALPEIESLADEWSSLLPSTGVQDPFHTHAWYCSWLAEFGAGMTPLLLIGRIEERLVGLLPLVRSRVSRRPWLALDHLQAEDLAFLTRRRRYGNVVPAWQLGGPANLQSMSIRASWLVRLGCETQFLSAVANYLAGRTDWDLLILPAIASGRTEGLAEALHGQQLRLEVHAGALSLFGLKPMPWPEYVKTRTSHFRKRARAIERSVHALGDIEVKAIQDREELQSALHNLFELARRSHKQLRRANQTRFLPLTDATVEFYSELANAYSDNGECVIHAVTCDGKLIAGLLSLIVGDRLFALLTYFAPEFQKVSPGRYLMQVLIDWAGNNGIQWIDYNGNSTLVRMFAKEPTHYDECIVFRARGFSSVYFWLYRISRRLLRMIAINKKEQGTG